MFAYKYTTLYPIMLKSIWNKGWRVASGARSAVDRFVEYSRQQARNHEILREWGLDSWYPEHRINRYMTLRRKYPFGSRERQELERAFALSIRMFDDPIKRHINVPISNIPVQRTVQKIPAATLTKTPKKPPSRLPNRLPGRMPNKAANKVVNKDVPGKAHIECDDLYQRISNLTRGKGATIQNIHTIIEQGIANKELQRCVKAKFPATKNDIMRRCIDIANTLARNTSVYNKESLRRKIEKLGITDELTRECIFEAASNEAMKLASKAHRTATSTLKYMTDARRRTRANTRSKQVPIWR